MVDAPCREGLQRVGFGGIVGSSTRAIKAVMMGFQDQFFSHLGAKLVEILKGLRLAGCLGLRTILILSDSLVSIQMLRGESTDQIEVINVLSDIKSHCAYFIYVSFQYLPLNSNTTTHLLAQVGFLEVAVCRQSAFLSGSCLILGMIFLLLLSIESVSFFFFCWFVYSKKRYQLKACFRVIVKIIKKIF